MTRDEIVERIEEQIGEAGEEIILFDGMEDAFLGVAERFEPVTVDDNVGQRREVGGEHRYFALYSYAKMVEILTADGDLTEEDACEYLEFNTVGLYAGPNTPAILRDF